MYTPLTQTLRHLTPATSHPHHKHRTEALTTFCFKGSKNKLKIAKVIADPVVQTIEKQLVKEVAIVETVLTIVNTDMSKVDSKIKKVESKLTDKETVRTEVKKTKVEIKVVELVKKVEVEDASKKSSVSGASVDETSVKSKQIPQILDCAGAAIKLYLCGPTTE